MSRSIQSDLSPRGKAARKAAGALLPRVVAAMLLALALTSVSTPPAQANCQSNVLTAGETNRSLTFGGRTRTYILHVPPGYTAKKPIPLVIDMHGFTSSASAQAGLSGFRQKADQAGFIVAWPQGVSNSWNAYGCCGTALSSNIDDVGFMRALVAEISNLGNIDHSRVYATGLSNGGSMSHRLACEAADIFAATAPVSFTLNHPTAQCNPSRPISVIHFHGLNDTTVPYNGGGSNNFQSAPASFAAWQQIDLCTGTPVTQSFGGQNRCETASCADGVHAVLCTLAGTHVLYNTQTVLNIANYAWDNELSHHRLPLPDVDSDGVADMDDNCPAVANADQADSDDNCVGDVCQGTPPPPPPPGTCVAGNTGLLNPSAQSADAGGDGNGFQTNPTNAFADGGGEASNTNGAGDRHRWFNYNVSIPTGCSIKGIEVRMDWRLDSTFGTSSMGVELSANAGSTWTAVKTDAQETTSLHTVTLGSASDTWGRTWTATDLGNANFRVRTTSNSTSSFRDFFLDWIPVRVNYGP